MLYLEKSDGFSLWSGETIDGIQHPAWMNYEETWSKDELNAIGLHRSADIAPASPAPDGKIVVSTWVERIEGIPTFVHELADAPPPEPNTSPLSLHTVACAALTVENGELVGMERSSGLVMAFMPDPETAWLFFEEEQADIDYIVTPSDGVSKYEDMIEITKPNPTSFRVIVQRLD